MAPGALPCGALAAALAAASPTASLADWSLSGFLSERVEAVGETGGEEPDSGLRSITDLGLTLRGRSASTSVTLSPGLRALFSTLDGEGGTPLPRLNGALAHDVSPRTRLTASASVIPDFVEEAQFEDTGARRGGDALQISLNGRVGATHRITSVDSGSIGLFARLREFTEDSANLSASSSWGLDAGWTRQIDPVTSLSLTPAFTAFSSDSAAGSNGQTFSLRAGFQQQVTSRLRLDATFGPSLTLREGEDDDAAIGAVGSLGLSYRDAVTTYTVGLSQDVDQNSDGELENRSSLRGGITRRLSPVSRIGLNGVVGLQTPLSGDGQDRRFLTLSPSYSHDLSDDWSLDLGYRFRASDRDELETSNTVFLQISRGLSLLP